MRVGQPPRRLESGLEHTAVGATGKGHLGSKRSHGRGKPGQFLPSSLRRPRVGSRPCRSSASQPSLVRPCGRPWPGLQANSRCWLLSSHSAMGSVCGRGSKPSMGPSTHRPAEIGSRNQPPPFGMGQGSCRVRPRASGHWRLPKRVTKGGRLAGAAGLGRFSRVGKPPSDVAKQPPDRVLRDVSVSPR